MCIKKRLSCVGLRRWQSCFVLVVRYIIYLTYCEKRKNWVGKSPYSYYQPSCRKNTKRCTFSSEWIFYLSKVEPCYIPHEVRSDCFSAASSPAGIESWTWCSLVSWSSETLDWKHVFLTTGEQQLEEVTWRKRTNSLSLKKQHLLSHKRQKHLLSRKQQKHLLSRAQATMHTVSRIQNEHTRTVRQKWISTTLNAKATFNVTHRRNHCQFNPSVITNS